MSQFRSRRDVLSCYFEVVKSVLRRERSFTSGRENFYRRFWTSAAEEIGADIDDVGSGLFRISRAGRQTLVQFNNVNVDSYFNRLLVDQKPIICALLSQKGYSTAKYIEYDIRSIDKAWGLLKAANGSFVVKPRRGAGGKGITTAINSYSRLRKASIRAAAFYSEHLMLEEQVPGDSYRLLFLDGKLLDVIRRCRPTIVGDGSSSIRKLIDDENKRRRSGGSDLSLFELKTDLDCEYYLEDHGYTLRTVAAPNQRVIVKNVVNENSSQDNFTVLRSVHQDFRKVGKEITSLLGLNLIGIDIMTTDISIPLDQSGGMINEINIPPGLHYHEMIANPEEAVAVGPRVLEFALSSTGIPTWLPHRAAAEFHLG